MEVVYSNDSYKDSDKYILGYYGDVINLNKVIDVQGIDYDDEWSVKRFLNGYSFKINDNIYELFKELNIDVSYLKYKIKYLPRTIFKYILLIYVIINNKKLIILDNIEVGLTYKEKKNVINLIRRLREDKKEIVIVSHDLYFLSKICEIVEVINGSKSVFYGSIDDLIKLDNYVEEPEIISFIKMANKKNANLSYTLDSKELLKDIYRSVC